MVEPMPQGPLPLKQWSKKHECCVHCKTTRVKHAGYGLCVTCKSHDRGAYQKGGGRVESPMQKAGLYKGDHVEIVGDPFGFNGKIMQTYTQDGEVLAIVKVSMKHKATVPLSKLSLMVEDGW